MRRHSFCVGAKLLRPLLLEYELLEVTMQTRFLSVGELRIRKPASEFVANEPRVRTEVPQLDESNRQFYARRITSGDASCDLVEDSPVLQPFFFCLEAMAGILAP